ncbi:MAG: hypothetical protein ACT4NY_05030 [Pseudonocardiales bacterium]
MVHRRLDNARRTWLTDADPIARNPVLILDRRAKRRVWELDSL